MRARRAQTRLGHFLGNLLVAVFVAGALLVNKLPQFAQFRLVELLYPNEAVLGPFAREDQLVQLGLQSLSVTVLRF
jgi:hypothetical protein